MKSRTEAAPALAMPPEVRATIVEALARAIVRELVAEQHMQSDAVTDAPDARTPQDLAEETRPSRWARDRAAQPGPPEQRDAGWRSAPRGDKDAEKCVTE